MIDYRTVQFKADHAKAVIEDGLNMDEGHDWDSQAKVLEDAGYAMTLLDTDEKPVLCLGVVPLWNGVGEGWLLGSKKMQDHPIAIGRAIKEVFIEYREHAGWWRVQSNVRADWPLAIKFIKFLGMEEEGLMKKFGPEGADYIRFAWIK